jgi:hypothetical protein
MAAFLALASSSSSSYSSSGISGVLSPSNNVTYTTFSPRGDGTGLALFPRFKLAKRSYLAFSYFFF